MTYPEAREVLQHCSKEGVEKPTIHRHPGNGEHWLMWFGANENNPGLQFFTFKGAKHFARALEYERVG